MSERKINLEEILYTHVYSKLNIKDLKEQIECEKSAMLEFGKQLLELAAENAKLIKDGTIYRNDYFELNRNNPYASSSDVHVYKQSILDTINQVE